jgi:hypothetical protein
MMMQIKVMRKRLYMEKKMTLEILVRTMEVIVKKMHLTSSQMMKMSTMNKLTSISREWIT